MMGGLSGPWPGSPVSWRQKTWKWRKYEGVTGVQTHRLSTRKALKKGPTGKTPKTL